MYPLRHHNFSKEYWYSKTKDFQILNIGSELQRAQNWIEKDKDELVNSSYDRALELIDLTREDPKWKKQLRELSRSREYLAGLRWESNKNAENNYLLFRNLVLLDVNAERLLKPKFFESSNF